MDGSRRRAEIKLLGLGDPQTSTTGCWPGGESPGVRAMYDHVLKFGTKTKICYVCRGTGGSNGNCTACQGTGTVPAAQTGSAD